MKKIEEVPTSYFDIIWEIPTDLIYLFAIIGEILTFGYNILQKSF